MRATLPFASPYIGVTTPFLYKATPGATAVTPAWRDAIWHLSVKWQFGYNDTLAERKEGYEELSAHVQKFRDLTPGSGAYFVSRAPSSPPLRPRVRPVCAGGLRASARAGRVR